MKKRIVLMSLIMLALLLAGGYQWIRFDVPEMDFDYTNTENSVYADWRLEKDGTAVIYGSGKLPWLEAECRARLYDAEEKGSIYALIKRKVGGRLIKKVIIGKDATGLPDVNDPPIDDSGFHFGDGIMEIEADPGNPFFSSADGVLFNKEKTVLLTYPNGKRDRSYTVSDGVTMIAAAAFRNCDELRSLILREGLQTIEEEAFERCGALEIIRLPETLSEIGERAFANCKRLKIVVVPAGLEEIGEYELGFYLSNDGWTQIKGFKIVCGDNAEAVKQYAKTYKIETSRGYSK